MGKLSAALLALFITIPMVDRAFAKEMRLNFPDVIGLPEDWYPESLAAGTDGSLYVGSWRQGAVARLRVGNPEPEIIVAPGSGGLANGQGILVDARTNSLWVCSGRIGYTTVPLTPSALKNYNLTTGKPRASYRLPDAGHCNDLVQDQDGSIYVTDSFHPRILRLKPTGNALEIWAENPLLGSGDKSYFLNGITFSTPNSLVVSPVMATSYLLQVELTPDRKVGPISLLPAPRLLKNVDAVRRLDEDHLILFESNAFGHDGPYGGAITEATLSGGKISSLTSLVNGLNDPSSGVIENGRVYYIESKYGLLFSHPKESLDVPRHVPFQVLSVKLPARFRTH